MRERVTPEDYGAVGDGATDDSAAWLAMLTYLGAVGGGTVDAHKSYYIPYGFEIDTDNVLIDGGGTGEIHALGQTNAALTATGASNITIQNLDIYIPRTNLRSGTFCMYFENCDHVIVRGCRTDGGVTGVWCYACDDVLVEGNTVDTPKADGIHFSHGSTRCKAIGNTILDPGDDALSTTFYAGSARPSDIVFDNNIVRGGHWGFGAAVYSADRVTITGNTFSELALGMVNTVAAAGGTACTEVMISGNNAKGMNRAEKMPESYWYGTDPALDPPITAESYKSGAYLAGTGIALIGNKISDVSSSGAQTRRGLRFGPCNILTVKDNTLSNVNGVGIEFGTDTIDQVAVDNNVLQSVFDIGIFCDTTITTGFSICGNTHGYGATGASPYSIYVGNTGSVPGRVCNNVSYTGKAVHNTGANGQLVAYNNTTSKKSATPYVPSVSAQTGSITSYTVNKAAYIEIEQLLHVQLDITINTNGTGATAVVISLPQITTGTQYIAGREVTVSGAAIVAEANVSSLAVRKYDGTYPGANSARLVLTGVLEKA